MKRLEATRNKLSISVRWPSCVGSLPVKSLLPNDRVFVMAVS